MTISRKEYVQLSREEKLEWLTGGSMYSLFNQRRRLCHPG